MQLTDIEARKVKNTIRRMAKVLSFAFSDKTDIYVGFYALMTAQMLICRYFDEDCKDEVEFKNVKRCLLKNLSDFTKTMYGTQFKGKEGK
jgi:hypothetical protein